MAQTSFESITPTALETIVGGLDEGAPPLPTGSQRDDFTTGGSFGNERGKFTTGGKIGGDGTFTTGGSF
jgi:hypothetical protein